MLRDLHRANPQIYSVANFFLRVRRMRVCVSARPFVRGRNTSLLRVSSLVNLPTWLSTDLLPL